MYLTIEQTAIRMDCTIFNIYNHIKRGNIKTEKKETHIWEIVKGKRKSIPTGEAKDYVLKESVEAYIASKKEPRRNAGKPIRATYTKGKQLFENGKQTIVFKSETLAQEGLELSKWTIRYRLNNNIVKDGLKLEAI
jgi:hypothetical protein